MLSGDHIILVCNTSHDFIFNTNGFKTMVGENFAGNIIINLANFTRFSKKPNFEKKNDRIFFIV